MNSNLLNFNNEDDSKLMEKINLEELYEKQHDIELKKLNMFQKVLDKVFKKIKTTSRQRNNKSSCFYQIPEFIIGVSNYDQSACILYVTDKLMANNLEVKYIHPNILFIYWGHYIPNFIKNEINKKLSDKKIDNFGLLYEKEENENIKEDRESLPEKEQKIQTKNIFYNKLLNS